MQYNWMKIKHKWKLTWKTVKAVPRKDTKQMRIETYLF